MVASASRTRAIPRVYLVTDRHQTRGRGLIETVEAAVEAGVDAVQLREKDLSVRELYELACTLREVCHRNGALLLVNDHIDVAHAARADGVHLPVRSFTPAEARLLLGPEAIVGSSCHTLDEAQRAAGLGADFLVFGPVFPTPSKAAFGPPVGLEELARVCATVSCPVLAIGGVGTEQVSAIRAAGAAGIAVVRAILSAPDPSSAARALVAAWSSG